jgi:NAD(P)-dependent dehydrogenase (short-subunit alcohol dehydrogenase family)
MTAEPRLAQKVVLITGAASGIGRATAHRFAQEGAKVVIADINRPDGEAVAAQITGQGGQAAFIETDVSQEAALQGMVEFTVATFGGLDIYHHNAYWTEAKPFMETSLKNWQQTLDVSLRPAFLGTQLAVPHLQARGGGVILFTASVQSIIGVPNFSAYQAAKGGLLSLTRVLALELAPTIRVVSILPGAIDTPAVGLDDKAGLAKLVEVIPLKRLGKPEEIAGLAAFLASAEGGYITGVGIVADGGMSVG